MLKQPAPSVADSGGGQPPSGGCVLKQAFSCIGGYFCFPAAFGRLCVETASHARAMARVTPAAFGRLCVETTHTLLSAKHEAPAAFGRLCVETALYTDAMLLRAASRLRAAVC